MSTSPAPSGPTTAALAPLPLAEADALQRVLAAAQAAVYAYGVVGAQTTPSRRAAALGRLQAYAARRDLLAGRLAAGGRPPAAAAPGYGLPFPVHTPRAASALAAHVESAVASGCADLVASVPGPQRVEASRWLAEAERAAGDWGATPATFPGLPEREPAR